MIEQCGIYIGIFVVQVVLFTIALISISKDKKKHIKIRTARVISSQQAEVSINGMYLKRYEIELEFIEKGKLINKTIIRGKSMEIDETIKVLYDSKDDEVTLLEAENKIGNALPNILCIIGVLLFIVNLVILGVRNVEIEAREMAYLSAIIAVSFFVCPLAYACVYKPNKRLKNSFMYDGVLGKQTDYIVKSNRKRLTFRGIKDYCVCTPIYEYYYSGKIHKLVGTVGSNTSRYKEIGRCVTIMINRQTKDVYCKEDEEDEKSISWIIMFILIAFICWLVCVMFFTDR